MMSSSTSIASTASKIQIHSYPSSSSLTTPSPSIHRRASRLTVRADNVEPTEKSVELMRKFSEQYARRSGTYFCVDKGVTSVVIKGLADHKDSLGAPLCPCRHYDDKAAEVGQGFWNCPCVPMRESVGCHSTHKLLDRFSGMRPVIYLCFEGHKKIVCPFFIASYRKECHCMLFLTPDNDFAGKDQVISLEEIKEATSNL